MIAGFAHFTGRIHTLPAGCDHTRECCFSTLLLLGYIVVSSIYIYAQNVLMVYKGFVNAFLNLILLTHYFVSSILVAFMDSLNHAKNIRKNHSPHFSVKNKGCIYKNSHSFLQYFRQSRPLNQVNLMAIIIEKSIKKSIAS